MRDWESISLHMHVYVFLYIIIFCLPAFLKQTTLYTPYVTLPWHAFYYVLPLTLHLPPSLLLFFIFVECSLSTGYCRRQYLCSLPSQHWAPLVLNVFHRKLDVLSPNPTACFCTFHFERILHDIFWPHFKSHEYPSRYKASSPDFICPHLHAVCIQRWQQPLCVSSSKQHANWAHCKG